MGSEAKFKVGDRVELVEDYGGYDAGTKATVTSLWSEGVNADTDGGGDFSCYYSRVKLVPSFKVGDRVRVVDAYPFMTGTKVGCPAVVTKDYAGGEFVTIELDHPADGKIEQLAKPYQIEHAPLVIEAGKFYTTRDGRRVGPMREHSEYGLIVVPGDGRIWSRKGIYGGKSGAGTDLIAEAPASAYTANAAAQVDNQADDYGGGKKAQKFKVGDRVRDISESGKSNGLATVTDVKGNRIAVTWSDGSGGTLWPATDFVLAAPHAIVAVIEDGQPKPATRPYVHADRAAAKAEAERLASINKGKTFGVYELVDEVAVEKTYEHEWQRLAAGGERVKAVKSLRELAGVSLKSAVDAVDCVKAAA